MGPYRGVHEETGFGGLARVSTKDIVVTTGLSPILANSGGAFWFDVATGDSVGREQLYFEEDTNGFGKSNGLGDLEIICGLDAVRVPTPQPTLNEPTSTAPPETAPSATPTSTRSATATRTATRRATGSPTASPTPPNRKIYVPSARRNWSRRSSIPSACEARSVDRPVSGHCQGRPS